MSMSKELKYKIKIVKDFDINKECEVIQYYIKKKTILGWWYLKDEEEELPVFLGLTVINLFMIIILGGLIKYNYQIDLFNSTYLFSTISTLSCFWYLLSFKMIKKDFRSKEKALKYITDEIRKSNLTEYHTSEDIHITYKNNTLEVEK